MVSVREIIAGRFDDCSDFEGQKADLDVVADDPVLARVADHFRFLAFVTTRGAAS